MTNEEALGALEQDGLATKLTVSMLLIALLRVSARRASDPVAFLAALRDDALHELEAAKFMEAETPAESQVREGVRAQISALTAVAGSPDAAARLRGGRPPR